MIYNISCFWKSYMCFLITYLVTWKKISRDDRRYIYNFSIELADDGGYSNETRGYTHINHEKITNNIYFVKTPIENNKLYIHTYIDINLV